MNDETKPPAEVYAALSAGNTIHLGCGPDDFDPDVVLHGPWRYILAATPPTEGLAPASTTKSETSMDRIHARASEHSKLRDGVAQMLYENGEMQADAEGGSMPAWEDLTGEDWFLTKTEHLHAADNILALDAKSCVHLAKILIDQAFAQRADLENQLWAKVERAKGFEKGSLRGWPGVRQEVAI